MTRAYIVNAKGLLGFLVSADPIHVLNQADAKGGEDLKQIVQWQVIDIKSICEYIGSKSRKEQFEFLGKHYPGLYIYV